MTLRRRLPTVLLTAVIGGLMVPSAHAAESGRIVEAIAEEGALRVVFQADGLPEGVSLDTSSVLLTVAGQDVQPSSVELVEGGSGEPVRRTAVLAIDNSRSMSGPKFAAAQAAATAFLDALPADVLVGLVTFGDTATVALPPTPDRASVQQSIDSLTLNDTVGTALFDGAATAVAETGDSGVRSVLLVTDGDEYGNSTATVESVVKGATDANVAIDAVYIGDDGAPPVELSSMVEGAGGQLVTSGVDDLTAAFQRAAAAISSQIVITADIPPNAPEAGNVGVSAQAGSVPLSDTAFTTFATSPAGPPPDAGPIPVERSAGPAWLTDSTLPLIMGVLFLGLLMLLFVALSGVGSDDRQGRVRRRLSLYTLTGRTPVKQEETTTVLGTSQVARSAVEFAGKVARKRGFEESLALRLEAAGVPLKAAEWMLIHVGVAIAAALLGLLISGGGVIATIIGLALGLGLPYAYLIVKESRRTSAFLAQLPDTLQLIAGSLSAGYSMPQAMDTVVREGSPPMTSEFNRALVEARLGVPIEDAMDGIAERMKSKDFAWVVMAIRIQREVGGNLAELLTTVSATLRERERLRRQVRVLSAEGRLSAWILGLLPPVFALYLLVVQPSYLKPLVTELLGWVLVGLGVTLLAIGALWMRKAVKVEV